MDQKILQDLSGKERLQALRDNAEKTELFNYSRLLDESKLSVLKDELTKDSVNLVKLEEARKEFLTDHKAKVKPLKFNVATTLNKLRSKVEEVEETVYLMADTDEGLMGFYNEEGLLLYTRALMPEERQLRIIDKTGTN